MGELGSYIKQQEVFWTRGNLISFIYLFFFLLSSCLVNCIKMFEQMVHVASVVCWPMFCLC